MTTQFKQGATYAIKSIGDSNTVFSFEVTKRTDKSVTVINSRNETRRCKITVIDDGETIRPMGTYSMAPTLRTTHEV